MRPEQFYPPHLFKVMLALEGTYELHYATRSYIVDQPALMFTDRLAIHVNRP